MTTRGLIATFVALGLVFAGFVFVYSARQREEERAMKLKEEEIDRLRKELARQQSELYDGGMPGRYYGPKGDGRATPCNCEPGDPLCSCL